MAFQLNMINQKSVNQPKYSGVKDSSCRICSLMHEPNPPKGYNLAWLTSVNYKAINSIGPLVPGWSLVCPIKHSVNLSEHYHSEEFWQFSSSAIKVLVAQYGQCVVFEHGPQSEESLIGCGTGHAHLHLVPLSFSLETEAVRFDNKLKWRRVLARDLRSISSGSEYLFVADNFDGVNTSGMMCIVEEPYSQFFRRIIANRVGLRHLYDYKRYPMHELTSTYAKKLRAAVMADTVN